MLTQYNAITEKKLNELRQMQEPSLRKEVLEKNHREASLIELRKILETVVKQPEDDYRKPSLKEMK